MNDKCDNHMGSDVGRRLVDLLNMFYFYQIGFEPTGDTDQEVSLLDLITTDSPGYILENGHQTMFVTGDHVVLDQKYKYVEQRNIVIMHEIQHYNNGDFRDLNRKFESENWYLIFGKCDNVNDYAEQICDKIDSLKKNIYL